MSEWQKVQLIFGIPILLVLAISYPPSHFRIIRKLWGGSWARVNGAMWGKRWIHLGVAPHRDAEEWWT